MRWRVAVTRHLRTHLAGIAPETKIAVVAPSKRDIDALCKVLPGATGFRVSEAGVFGGAEMESRDHPSGGHSAGGDSLAESEFDVLVAWLVVTRFSTERRLQLLAEFRRALRVGGTLLVVDHNRPRTWGQRLANVGWCLLRGVEPYARPAYPVAREVKDAAFERISLRMVFHERVQIVRGIRPPVAVAT